VSLPTPLTVIRGTRIVLPDRVRPASIHIAGGAIVRVAPHDETPEHAELIDVGDLVVTLEPAEGAEIGQLKISALELAGQVAGGEQLPGVVTRLRRHGRAEGGVGDPGLRHQRP